MNSKAMKAKQTILDQMLHIEFIEPKTDYHTGYKKALQFALDAIDGQF